MPKDENGNWIARFQPEPGDRVGTELGIGEFIERLTPQKTRVRLEDGNEIITRECWYAPSAEDIQAECDRFREGWTTTELETRNGRKPQPADTMEIGSRGYHNGVMLV